MNPINIFLGFLPSILWLNFYLKEDVRPEPKYLVLKIFFLGILVAFLAIFFEFYFLKILLSFDISPFLFQILKFFFIIALVEEFLKFLVVFLFIFNHPEFEEPVDGMIYMIISALGFAATENTLISLSSLNFLQALQLSLLRFLGATFLHALCSGIFGFFVSLYYFRTRKKINLLFGLSLSTFLHGFYNFSIISIKDSSLQISFIFFFLFALFVFASFLFKRLKK